MLSVITDSSSLLGGLLTIPTDPWVAFTKRCTYSSKNKSSTFVSVTNTLVAFTNPLLTNTPTGQLVCSINILVLSFSNPPG